MDFIKLLNHSKMVLTDSGGVQREAYLLRKPVVVLRRTTEWVELVEAGVAVLYDIEYKGIDISKIVEWRPERYVEGLLGDENAPQRIAEIISSVLRSRG
jgi:UDP-N-acetylglucosamine 2-epimerase